MKHVLISLLLSLAMISTASADNDTQLIQQLLDSEQLRGYWHIKQFPERSPLVVVLPDEQHTDEACLTMFGEKVRLTTTPPNDGNFFIVSSISNEPDNVVMEYAYPPEGLRGTAAFKRSGGEWVLIDVQVFES